MEDTYTLEGLRGVGRVELALRPNQRAYVFFGSNGVGKTKCLEGLFQFYFLSNKNYLDSLGDNNFIFENKLISSQKINSNSNSNSNEISFERINNNHCKIKTKETHSLPVVFLGAGKRGHIDGGDVKSELLGDFEKRKKDFFGKITQGMKEKFSSLGMDSGLEEWFVTIAHAANPYQKSTDNRKIEIETILQLLHEVDHRYDPNFMEIDGFNHVSLKVDGVITEIRNLSTGFASLLKIFQTIISGYGNFTNSKDLKNVKGLVFIDEIEGHLHSSWQSKIIPLLKKLFPNTTFFVATHSPIVLSQLEEGEAYRLERQEDDVVRALVIEAPNKRILSDVLEDAMDVNLNQLKIKSLEKNSQEDAKKALLEFFKIKKMTLRKDEV